MAKCMNMVTLLGNVGRDPKQIDLAGGGTLATFSLATSRSIGKDKPEITQWHTCTAWGGERSKLADLVMQLVTKGARVCVNGELRYREWEKDGQKHTSAEVVIADFVLCGGGSGDRTAQDSPYAKPGTPMKHGKPAPLRAEGLAKVEADLRALHARVSEQADTVEQGKLPRLVTGAHCTYCSARPACPAHVAEARALVTGDLALLAAPMTMEQIVRGAGIVGPARAALEKLDDMCRLHVNLQGPIPLAGGRVFGPRASEKQVFHTRETYQAIREEIDPLVGEAEGARLTDAAFGTSKDAIYDVLREAHKIAGLKGKMKEAYERITAKPGVVSTVPAEKWGAHYPKETE